MSERLAGEPVGLHRIGEETWLVKYGPVLLGTVKDRGPMRRIKAVGLARAHQGEGSEGKAPSAP